MMATTRRTAYLGVDIGGTKSHALVASEDGQVLGFGQAGPGNYEVVGWAGLARTLADCVQPALAAAGLDAGQIAAAGMGVAGYDWPGERQQTLEAIATLELTCPLELVNDATIALVAGASQGWGVAVVAGTSCNCRGRDRQGREGRVTGGGGDMGENAGAVELIAHVVKLLSVAWSRRGPATALTEAFCRLVGAADGGDLLEGLYLRRYQLTAAAAPLIFQTAASGDAVARGAVEWAGRELAGLAQGVIRQLELQHDEFELVLAGSLYDGGPLLVETMQREVWSLAPGARFVRLTVPPVVGGVLLAMDQAGLPTTSLRPALVAATRARLGVARIN